MTILAMTRLMIGSVATRGRLIAMGLLGLIGVIIAFAVDRSGPSDDFVPAELLSDYGLTLFVPVVVLVVASATLGSLVEDSTLVYLWLRPIGRWRVVAAALLAATVVLLPLVLIPMIAMAGFVGDSGDVAGVTLASLVGLVGYGSVFTLLGLLTQRALAWGLLYILIWEGFIAGLSRGAGWFAVRTYTRSALAQVGDVSLIDNPVATATTIIVAAGIALVTFALTTGRLRTMDVA